MKNVLDHGYVKLIETWGSDERIIEAARMSTCKGFLGWCVYNDESGVFGCTCEPKQGDERLLAFLWNNKHATPFEMAGATFEIQAPIFVFREWHRHRTQSYNEMSARYAPLPDLNYIPTVERLMLNASAGGKQAGSVTGAEALTLNAAEFFQRELARIYNEAEVVYQEALFTHASEREPAQLDRLPLAAVYGEEPCGTVGNQAVCRSGSRFASGCVSAYAGAF